MKISWTSKALFDYYQNLDYLLMEWGEQVAIDFANHVNTIIEIICEYPDIFPLSSYRGIRKAVINKRITLYYKADEDTITLMRFWNNYKDPEKREL